MEPEIYIINKRINDIVKKIEELRYRQTRVIDIDNGQWRSWESTIEELMREKEKLNEKIRKLIH